MNEYYLIPNGSQEPYFKRLLTWFWGIDAIEIQSGDFVIPDAVDGDLDNFPTTDARDLKAELNVFPKIDESEIVFNEYEQISDYT
jgi:hypothetical protein